MIYILLLFNYFFTGVIMNKTKVKIGQVLTCQDEYIIKSPLSDTEIVVKPGDTCIVRSDKTVSYKSGNARGKIQSLSDEHFEIDGYDFKNIVSEIVDALKYYIPFSDMMDDYDVTEEEVRDAILEPLEDLLG